METDSTQETSAVSTCPNCSGLMQETDRFCPHCGQKRFVGRVRMRDFIRAFLAKAFHINNKFLLMSRHLFVPAKVSLDYFSGKIKRYPNPLQFFFISMFIAVLLSSNMDSDDPLVNFNLSETQDTTVQAVDIGSVISRSAYAREVWDAFEQLPDSLRSTRDSFLLDTLTRITHGEELRFFRAVNEQRGKLGGYGPAVLDSIPLTLGTRIVMVSTHDFRNLEPKELAEKYGLDHWVEYLMVKQGKKAILEPKSLRKAYLGSFVWTILALIIGISGVLYLLYYRRGYYLAEHFVFLLHLQTANILLVSAVLLVNLFVTVPPQAIVPVALLIGVFIFMSMKNYYRESWGWTFLKFFALVFSYIFMFALFFVFTLVLVFFLF